MIQVAITQNRDEQLWKDLPDYVGDSLVKHGHLNSYLN